MSGDSFETQIGDEVLAGKDRSEDGEGAREKYLYALAEVENTKKRLQRQYDESARALKRRMLLQFLPILDNLERSLAYRDSEGLREGLAATVRGFEETLSKQGVTPILTTGEPFDPEIAEAIGTQPAPNTKDGHVIAETERGYLLDDTLLRPAKVIVAKND